MSGFTDWLQHSTPGLLLLALVGIAILLLMIIQWKVEPFIALLVIGLLTALAAGLPVQALVGSAQKPGESLLETGFGGILGHIAVIIGLGTMLGAILERSGGAHVLTRALLRALGENRAPLAMGLAGLSVTHAFLPPHPGPVAAAGLLGVDLGWVILMGAVCAIPAWYIGGVLFSSWIGKRINIPVPEEMLAAAESNGDEERGEPGLGLVVGIIAIPLVLILAGTFGSIVLPAGSA